MSAALSCACGWKPCFRHLASLCQHQTRAAVPKSLKIMAEITADVPRQNQAGDESSDGPYRAEAREQFNKQAKTWPEGKLTEGWYGDATNNGSLHIQYLYEPEGAGGLGVSLVPFSLDQSLLTGVASSWR
jgi:hypothetical protein